MTLIACTLGPADPVPASPATAAVREFRFDRHDLVTGPAARQTVLTGFLLDGAIAELAVVTADDNDDRRLRIYAFGEATWEPVLEQPLGPEVWFVDVARIGGRDRLLTYQRGRLSWFDPESATPRPLVAVTSDFSPLPRGGIPHVDVTRDVNHDGRDDLVVPVRDGFRVFVQRSDGAFADPVTIGPSPGQGGRLYGPAGYRHSPWADGGVYELDYDRDGRSDLVFWSRGRFQLHRQDERGLFAREAETFTAAVPLDGGRNLCARRPEHGFDSYRACYESDHSALTRGDRVEKLVHSFSDLNRDGVADLVVFSLEGRSVLSVRSTYEVYFGRPTPAGGTAFGPEVGAAIPSDGVQVVMEEHDYDGDGQTDLMLTSLDMGFFKAIGGLLSGSMSLDLALYRMEGGAYPDRPDLARKIKLDLSRSEPGKNRAAYPSVLIGDVNGDGRSDLLLGKGRNELRVYFGVPGPELFGRRPWKLSVPIPNDEKYTWLVDLDRDGRQDVLLHQRSATKPHRLTLLVSR